MEDWDIRQQTEETICMLYQNREQEAMKHVAEVLPLYQEMVQKLLVERQDESATVYFYMLKELLEHYQAGDMLGMADCLQKKALSLIEYYDGQDVEREKEEGYHIDEDIGEQ